MAARRSLELGLLLCLLPRIVWAQPVLTFERLGDALNAGDEVRVVDLAGREHTGPVATLSPDAIALARAGGATQRFGRADVQEVWMRRQDPVSNGALIGFGSVAATYCGLAVSSGHGRHCGIAAVLLGGVGAGIGALADAAISRQRLVFRAADGSVSLSLAATRTASWATARLRW